MFGPLPQTWRRQVTVTLEPRLRRRAVPLILALCVLIGGLVRLFDVSNVPRGFFTDEASYGVNSYLILTTGRDEYGARLPLFFRAFGEYKLPLFIYGEIPFIAVLGRTEFAVRAASAVFGTLTILTTYLLAKELFRRELPALTAAACLAVMPWHIHYSRTGFGEVVILPLVFTLAFFLFFRATRDTRFILPAALVLGLTFYAYRPAWIIVPPLLLVMLIVHRDSLLADRRRWGMALAVIALLLLPIGYHVFLSGSGDRSQQASILNIESEESTLTLFSRFYRSYFTEAFLFSRGDDGPILRHYLPGHGHLYWWQLPLIFAGVGGLLAWFNRRFLFILLLLLLYPLSGALSDSSPISTRTILGTVAFALLTGAGLATLLHILSPRGRHRHIARGLILTGLVLVGSVSFGAYLVKYHTEYAAASDGYWGWQDGPEAIIRYFVEHESEYDQLIMDGEFNDPSIFFHFYAEGRCQNCIIGDTERYNPRLRQLFALRPKNVHADQFVYREVHRLYDLNGELAFLFFEIVRRR